MGDLKWPSFAIQGIILATIIAFIIKDGGYQYADMVLKQQLLMARCQGERQS